MRNSSRDENGFTLLEMAVVLFIISLLLSGTLRGAELINSADVKGLAKDFHNVQTLLHTYQDKYRAQPGDDRMAVTHLGAAALPGNGNGVIDGNWHDAADASEASRIWQHLRLAGLTGGATDFTAADYTARNARGHPMGLQAGTGDPAKSPITNRQGAALAGTPIMCSRGIEGRLARALDIKLDDGNPATGSMLVTLDTGATYSPGASAATVGTGAASDIQPNLPYIVCLGF